MPLTSFSPGQTISSSAANANFALCVLTDTARTISVTHVWTLSQTFTGGFTAVAVAAFTGGFTTGAASTLSGDLLFTDATYDIGKSGATRPRDGFFSRTVSIGTSLLLGTSVATSVGAGDLACANNKGLRGVIADASDTYPLLKLDANNRAQLGGDGVTISIPQTTAGTVLIGTTDATGIGVGGVRVAGASRFNGTLTVAGLTLSAAAGKIVPGATSLSLRNTADSADNVLVSDAGNVTVRGSLGWNGGATIAKVLTNTVVWDIPSTVSQGFSSTTVTVTGAAVGDLAVVAQAAMPSTFEARVFAHVSAADTVTLVYKNDATGATDPASVTFRVIVFQMA